MKSYRSVQPAAPLRENYGIAKLAFPSRGAHAPGGGGADMRSPTHYLKIDLWEHNAFGKAQWLSSVRGATPFETNIEAVGVKSMMPGASGVIGVNERFYVTKVGDVGGAGSAAGGGH
jgi:hypothetical protein